MTLIYAAAAVTLALVTAACVFAIQQAARVIREARTLPYREASH